MAKKYLPIILILLAAFVLRTYNLTEVPPGLTHDEANHGRDAINILDGELLFYFPLNYGSEPLYNYVVAGLMALVGESLFALRLVNVFFGILVIAITYLWAKRIFSQQPALVTAGLIAVSFWPIATSRQALRAGLLPFLIVLAVWFFWSVIRQATYRRNDHGRKFSRSLWWSAAGLSIGIAATLHDYLAARILWLIFPLLLVYAAIMRRDLFRRIWRPTLAGLVGAGLLVIPMFAYVQAHPEAETRIQMLDSSLQSISAGNLGPVFKNFSQGLLAIIWPGYGDHFLAYNIPGKPVLGAIAAIFFLVGLFLVLWRWRRPEYAFLAIWFIVGILPSLITGPEANTTRNIGALPVMYLIAALGFTLPARYLTDRWGPRLKVVVSVILVGWLIFIAYQTCRDYFSRWSLSPDVRAAYQHTLIETLNYALVKPVNEPLVISTVYPGAAHDPSIAQVILPDGKSNLRWIDARFSLLFPGGKSASALVPSSTPIHPAFNDYIQLVETVLMKAGDLDSSFALYRIKPVFNYDDTQGTNFGNALLLLEGNWLKESVRPGEVAEFASVWKVIDPEKAGPIVPPAFETDVVLFSHVLDATGEILTQRDALEAPSWAWQSGDVFIQIHPVTVPVNTPAGAYETVVGIYDRSSGDRLPVIDEGGTVVGTRTFVVPLIVNE